MSGVAMSGVDAAWWAVTVDCTNVRRVATFWSGLLGSPVLEVGADRPGWLRLQPAANAPFLNFQPVAEAKVGKARLHIDVLVGDLRAGVERAVGLGGTDTGVREELPRGHIAVLLDPGGNEFCLLAAPRSSEA